MDRVLGDRASDRVADRSGDQLAVDGVWSDDPVERYFACITTCSLDDGECITICTEQLRQSP
jgi:hypothetical protein